MDIRNRPADVVVGFSVIALCFAFTQWLAKKRRNEAIRAAIAAEYQRIGWPATKQIQQLNSEDIVVEIRTAGRTNLKGVSRGY